MLEFCRLSFWMRPCLSLLRREGVPGIGHSFVFLFHQCIYFFKKNKNWILSFQSALLTITVSKNAFHSTNVFFLVTMFPPCSARNVSFQTLYGDQFTLSTQLIKLKLSCCTPPLSQLHSVFKNIPLLLKGVSFVHSL